MMNDESQDPFTGMNLSKNLKRRISRFAFQAGMSEDEAIDWITDHHLNPDHFPNN